MTAAARRHSSEATKPVRAADEAIKSAASGSEAVFALVQLPIGYCRQRANWLRRRRRVRFVASSADICNAIITAEKYYHGSLIATPGTEHLSWMAL